MFIWFTWCGGVCSVCGLRALRFKLHLEASGELSGSIQTTHLQPKNHGAREQQNKFKQHCKMSECVCVCTYKIKQTYS